MVKFSLILATKARTDEVLRLFEGFREQTFQDFEIIVSDQNADDRVVKILQDIAWQGKITHIRSDGGLSAARNAGLALAQGEIIGFPDDDCRYPPTLLQDVSEFFSTHPEYGYLSGRSVSDDGGDAASRHAKTAGPVERFTIYRQCIEFALFVRRSAIGETRFDENMGVGARSPWQSDEGPDFLLNLEAKGIRGYYDPSFAVWHPKVEALYNEALISRNYKYACGSGYFLRKHQYPFWFFAKLNLRTLAGALASLLTIQPTKARFYFARLKGRWRGWTGWTGEASVAGVSPELRPNVQSRPIFPKGISGNAR
jgi:glycosyltransferase involved in cell wall biosynthesis